MIKFQEDTEVCFNLSSYTSHCTNFVAVSSTYNDVIRSFKHESVGKPLEYLNNITVINEN